MKKCIAVVEITPEEWRNTMSIKKSREIIEKRKKDKDCTNIMVVDVNEDIDIIISLPLRSNKEFI